MKKVIINLYSFDELNEAAQQNAINDHRAFLESLPIEGEDENGEMEEVYRDNFSREEVIENIQINDYLFFFDGNLAPCTTYTGKHERAGETVLNFHGQEIKL